MQSIRKIARHGEREMEITKHNKTKKTKTKRRMEGNLKPQQHLVPRLQPPALVIQEETTRVLAQQFSAGTAKRLDMSNSSAIKELKTMHQ